MPRKLGQHFLNNPSVLRVIVRALAPAAGETVVEIGPGHGELTRGILRTGAQVIAIERDARLAEEFRHNFPGTEIVTGNALRELPRVAAGLGPFKLAGNIPYYITGHLFRVLSEMPVKPTCTTLLIQKEVAERLAAAPPRMNRLAASVQAWAEPKVIKSVSPGNFSPPPRVESAIVRLLPKRDGGSAQYFELMRALYRQPRKTVWNNLRPLLEAEGLGREAAERALREAGVDPAGRGQDLSPEKIARLAELLFR